MLEINSDFLGTFENPFLTLAIFEFHHLNRKNRIQFLEYGLVFQIDNTVFTGPLLVAVFLNAGCA
jgi:hypothetical protein